MTQSGWLSIQAVPGASPSPADTTTRMDASRWGRSRGHVHGIIAGVIWLAVVLYGLWLATRVVRAVERIADKFQPRGP